MAKPRVSAGGGLAALVYAFRMGRQAGGLLRLYRRMRSRNTCKTCALGMGGQRGGMVNEAGHFPEVCKKSLQAQAADMSGSISEPLLRDYPIARLRTSTPAQLERLGRITFPMVVEENDTHLRRISWEEALNRTARAFQYAGPVETFFYASGRASNEAAFLMQVVARAFGTQNINNCSFYCHSASGVALSRVYGSGTASVTLDDLDKTDLVVIAGANPASNHPRLITQLVRLRRRGGRVIVINPLRELGLVRFRVPSDWRSFIFGSNISDLYLQPHIGGDVALFKAMLKGVLEAGGVTSEYIDNYTDGWEQVKNDVSAASWDDLVAASGVSRAAITQAVDMLLTAKRGIFCWAMGLTHHVNGVDNVLSLSNLALARGWLGSPGCGLLPIRGHSNVQGIGSMGMTPSLKKAFAERMQAVYGIPPPGKPGMDTYRSMQAAADGRVRAAFFLGGNLFASNPDRKWASEALRNIRTTVYVSTKLNEGHIHGRGKTSLILPALARDEELQTTTQESMFNFVRLSDGGLPSVEGEMRSEVDIIASLAERILPRDRFDWSAMRSHRQLREAMARVVPGYEAIGEMDRTQEEFQIDGRTFHEPQFATPSGKAQFHVTPLPAFAQELSPHGPGAGGDEPAFRLMTVRSEGQFNTVVYEEADIYRGNRRRDVVMMAREDAERLGLAEGDRVTVSNDTGRLEVSVAIVDIRPGNLAMYYPEANELVPRRLDEASGTPAFKSVVVRVQPPAR
ncbi:MAG: FdhF/YdeP family oxidoreductase [Candidatus Krumholzibacteria bacterium]